MEQMNIKIRTEMGIERGSCNQCLKPPFLESSTELEDVDVVVEDKEEESKGS